MKRNFAFFACIGTLFLAACTSDSSLPEPTGKGQIRAINAIAGSPKLAFKIEERPLGDIAYKDSSAPAMYDDFDYVFNFDADIPGEADDRRIASVPLKVENMRDHIIVLTGDIDAPTVTTWTIDIREWDGSETVFEARFAHLDASLGDIDVFFSDAATPPAAGMQVARLSYGDIMDPMDFASGNYAITVTAANDTGTVHYTSPEQGFGSATSHVFSIFAGNENDAGPHVVTSMSTNGLALRLPDLIYDATIRFIHSAKTLQAVDIYEDETLTTLVTSNVDFGFTTVDLDTALSEKTYYFAPATSTATTLFQQGVASPSPGQHTEMFLIGDTDAWQGVYVSLDRSSTSTFAKVSIFHGAFNSARVDYYFVARGETITDDDFPKLGRVGYGLPPPTLGLQAGSYDIYVTLIGERDAIGGPYQLDVVLGDVVFLQIVDADDPTRVDIQFIPTQ